MYMHFLSYNMIPSIAIATVPGPGPPAEGPGVRTVRATAAAAGPGAAHRGAWGARAALGHRRRRGARGGGEMLPTIISPKKQGK